MSLYRIDKVFNFEKGTLQSSKCEAGKYDFLTASSDWKTHKEYSYDCEALVFAAAASGSLGRTHYVKGKFIASDLCFIITPKDPINFPIDLKFYHIIFNELKKDIVKNTKAGTSKEAIGLTKFGSYELPYFDIKKQVEIKKQFVEAEEAKENITDEFTHQHNLVKQLRQSFLTEAMKGKLVKQKQQDGNAKDLLEKIKAEKTKLGKKEKPIAEIKDEEIPFDIPENWVWCRLGEICTKVTDGFHNTPPKSSEGVPYIAATHVKSDKIDWSNCHYVSEKYHRELFIKAFPRKGELLVVNIGAGCGTPAIIDVDFEFSFKNTAILKFNQSLISNKLLFYYFLLRKDEIYVDLTKGGLQPFLSLKILNEIYFPLPPLPEQNRIVRKLVELMKLCDELQASIKTSKEQNEMLLQGALRDALKKEENPVETNN